MNAPAPFVGFYTARITDTGVVPGYARQLTAPEHQPTTWTAATGQINFLTPGSSEPGIAENVRADGTILGGVEQGADGYLSPAIFDAGSRRILALPGRFGVAYLAAGDTIVGISIAADGSRNDLVVWQNEQYLGEVRNLPGNSHPPFDINVHGRYVGVYSGFGIYGGFIGQGLDARELILPGFPLIRALGINDANTVVGMFLPDGNTRVGYVAHDDGHGVYTATRLSPLPGDVESPVWAINNNDDMVGLSTPAANGFPETATVYFAGSTTPVDMNTLIDPIPGVHLVRGIDINNLGQILVEGATPQGYRYYVLTPIPEPETLALIALSLLAIQRRSRSLM